MQRQVRVVANSQSRVELSFFCHLVRIDLDKVSFLIKITYKIVTFALR